MKRADQLDAIIMQLPVSQIRLQWLRHFVDDDVSDRTKLDAIVTVVDAVHLDAQLGEHHEAEEYRLCRCYLAK